MLYTKTATGYLLMWVMWLSLMLLTNNISQFLGSIRDIYEIGNVQAKKLDGSWNEQDLNLSYLTDIY